MSVSLNMKQFHNTIILAKIINKYNIKDAVSVSSVISIDREGLLAGDCMF